MKHEVLFAEAPSATDEHMPFAGHRNCAQWGDPDAEQTAELHARDFIRFIGRRTIAEIQIAVADYYGISPLHMTSKSREWRYSHPRQLAMLIARELTASSLPEIGRRFGQRDHTTVLHALRATSERIVEKPLLARDYLVLKAALAA